MPVFCSFDLFGKNLVIRKRNSCADRGECVYAISIYGFSFAFSMFLSTWHSHFFHLTNIGSIVALSAVLFSVRASDPVSNKSND